MNHLLDTFKGMKRKTVYLFAAISAKNNNNLSRAL